MIHRIGAQTIPWGENIRANMQEIVRFLSENGYSGAETGMRHFDARQPGSDRDLYAAHGIVPLGLHSGGQFWDPAAAEAERGKLSDAVNFAAEVGFAWMVVSGNKAETVDSMRVAAETYSQIGQQCREAGLRLAYHNHNWELADDAEILDTLVQSTNADDVGLVLDIAWAHVGGHDLAELMRRYGDRVAYLHIKDVAAEKFCELGTGEVDLDGVLHLADEYGIEWLVVEQDYTSLTAEQSMLLNRQFLTERGW